MTSQYGELVSARALLDQGSDVSLITERLVHQLCVPQKAFNVRVIGVGKQCDNKTRGVVQLLIKPRFDSSVEFEITAYILPNLTELIPKGSPEPASWPHLQNLLLADPHFAKPGVIDIILGAEIYGHLLECSILKGPSTAPIAQASKLGWFISGAHSLTCRRVSNLSLLMTYMIYWNSFGTKRKSAVRKRKLCPQPNKNTEITSPPPIHGPRAENTS